ncbi:MAG: hypothetical protein AAF664_08325 [Planctomycetota bacterium]
MPESSVPERKLGGPDYAGNAASTPNLYETEIQPSGSGALVIGQDDGEFEPAESMDYFGSAGAFSHSNDEPPPDQSKSFPEESSLQSNAPAPAEPVVQSTVKPVEKTPAAAPPVERELPKVASQAPAGRAWMEALYENKVAFSLVIVALIAAIYSGRPGRESESAPDEIDLVIDEGAATQSLSSVGQNPRIASSDADQSRSPVLGPPIDSLNDVLAGSNSGSPSSADENFDDLELFDRIVMPSESVTPAAVSIDPSMTPSASLAAHTAGSNESAPSAQQASSNITPASYQASRSSSGPSLFEQSSTPNAVNNWLEFLPNQTP